MQSARMESRDPKKERAARLRQAREAAGFRAARQAAMHFRWAVPTYQGHENGNRGFSLEDAERYARAFKVDPLWLFAGADGSLPQTATEPQPNARVAEDVDHLPPAGNWPRDVPVLGTAEGGAGQADFEMNGQVIDYIRRPPGIANLRDVFAVYVVGDSMVPWRRAGEPVYCSNARRRPGPGDYVVVEMHPSENGEAAPCYVKLLVAVRGPSLVLGQHNPERDDLMVPMARVRRITRVIDWPELVGV